MKKGFTLIELLAVIVILAIIALIATPIVLNIINNTKMSSNERSAELYISALEQAIAKRNLNGEFNPTQCEIENSVVTCDGQQLVVEINGDKPISGAIVFENSKVKLGTILKFSSFTVIINENGSLKIEITNISKKSKLCTVLEQQPYSETIAYSCKVDPNHDPYIFYKLSENKDDNNNIVSYNLIMDRNICDNGEETNSTNNCLLPWVSKEDYILSGGTESAYGSNGKNNKGPITANNYLVNATSNWKNLNSLNENYLDEGGKYGTIRLTGYARMPKKSEIESVGCGLGYGSCPAWMVNGLKSYTLKYPAGTKEDISGISGYWISSSDSSDSSYAVFVGYYGRRGSSYVNSEIYYGVRPVITVSVEQI